MSLLLPPGARQHVRDHPVDDLAITEKQISDEYDLDEIVGRGAHASVYRAKHIKTGNTVAVKIINKAKAQFDPHHKGFSSEIKLMQAVKHINILEFIEYFNTPKDLYIVMEYAWGGTLADHLKKNGPLTEAEARVALVRVVTALAFLHEQGFIHRDVKPQNILIMRTKHLSDVKLGDFGTSRANPTKATTFIGTPAFLAPEMLAEGKLSYGKEVDAWAVGVLVYQLLSNTLPFQGRDTDELYQNIRESHLAFPSSVFRNVSEHAIDFMTRLLKVDPSERMSMTQALKHPWMDLQMLAARDRVPRFMQFTETYVKRQAARVTSEPQLPTSSTATAATTHTARTRPASTPSISKFSSSKSVAVLTRPNRLPDAGSGSSSAPNTGRLPSGARTGTLRTRSETATDATKVRQPGPSPIVRKQNTPLVPQQHKQQQQAQQQHQPHAADDGAKYARDNDHGGGGDENCGGFDHGNNNDAINENGGGDAEVIPLPTIEADLLVSS